jgi:hypothetical protein
MSKAKFKKHPTVPSINCFNTAGNMLWKMRIREWAFAKVTLVDVEPNTTITSNNPTIVPNHNDGSAKQIEGVRVFGTQEMTVSFYANRPGFSYVYLFQNNNQSDQRSELLQVEVVSRNSPSKDKVSLTKLLGKTVAINSPDTNSYNMASNIKLAANTIGLSDIFARIAFGTNHLVLGSHGGIMGAGGLEKISMFVTGMSHGGFRLDIDNIEDVFAPLKGRMATDAVIWLGGCNIGANDDFCKKASKASGCVVVAPYYPLLDKRYDRFYVDILDGVCIPKIFKGDQLLTPADFCGEQKKYKFEVPI